MKKFYTIVAIATSLLFFYLTIEMFFMSESFVGSLGLEPTATTTILARRVAMFMLGISVLMFSARNLLPSPARQTICLGMATTLFGLSCMGTYEFVRGTVNSTIWVAITAETVLWVSFAWIMLKNTNIKVS